MDYASPDSEKSFQPLNGLICSNVHFILVRPIYLGNIGSAARVLKNFGFRNLRFVQPPKGYKDSEARRMSVDAFDLLKEGLVFDSLSDALKDIQIAIGTTSAQQRAMSPAVFDTVSADLIEASKHSRIAILFGDERNGLPKEDLDRCHHVVTIQSDPAFPALNLSQAIGVIAYELIRGGVRSLQPANGIMSGLSAAELTEGLDDDELFAQLGEMLESVGFVKSFNRENVMTELRSFYQRAHPTQRESDLLRGALHKINDGLKGRAARPRTAAVPKDTKL